MGRLVQQSVWKLPPPRSKAATCVMWRLIQESHEMKVQKVVDPASLGLFFLQPLTAYSEVLHTL